MEEEGERVGRWRRGIGAYLLEWGEHDTRSTRDYMTKTNVHNSSELCTL